MSRIAFGLKAHSGWAALVAVAPAGDAFEVVERRRLELVAGDDWWAKQPYHAAEELARAEGHALIRRAITAARKAAASAMRQAVRDAAAAGRKVTRCAILAGAAMPDWTVDEILAVHFRMHQAEGELFRDVLARGAEGCGLQVVRVPEKSLYDDAARILGKPAARLRKDLASLGKTIGPPWAADQKDAALAAMIALRRGTR